MQPISRDNLDCFRYASAGFTHQLPNMHGVQRKGRPGKLAARSQLDLAAF
jgi:hypothetical protein